MKTKYFFFGLLVAAFLTVPLIASAVDLGGDLAGRAATGAGYSAATDTTASEIIGEIIQIALSFVGVIFLVLTVYAGFLWMNARGEQSDIDKAQGILRTAIVGMIITVGAYSITSFVVPKIVSKTVGEATNSGEVGCCLIEDDSGAVIRYQIVGSQEECERSFAPGCVPGIVADDCEFSYEPSTAACAAQVPAQ